MVSKLLQVMLKGNMQVPPTNHNLFPSLVHVLFPIPRANFPKICKGLALIHAICKPCNSGIFANYISILRVISRIACRHKDTYMLKKHHLPASTCRGAKVACKIPSNVSSLSCMNSEVHNSCVWYEVFPGDVWHYPCRKWSDGRNSASFGMYKSM